MLAAAIEAVLRGQASALAAFFYSCAELMWFLNRELDVRIT